MKFGIIKERKNPPDKRVVFSPSKLQEFQDKFPESEIVVESSDIRVFSDKEYEDAGFQVVEDMTDCDVLLGVKEVPVANLIPDKKYFFFSHTIKKQPYNRKLLREILAKKIEMYDHETITKPNGARLIGFGRYAGLVGAYNGLRAIGLKEGYFTLPKVATLKDLEEVKAELDKIQVPNLKILLSGTGKVSKGAQEILDHLNIKQVSDALYLTSKFTEPVYCLVDVMEYAKRKDGKVGNKFEFYKNPTGYESNFMPYAKETDFFIAGHFFGDGAPYLFTREDVRSDNFNIKYVADISCDVDGPVATTIRASTIANPIYGYDPQNECEVAYNRANSILVMAVDNLPCELPKDASEGFGDMFLEHVIPAFYNNDKHGILERAKMTNSMGALTSKYKYLQDFVDGKE
ncbi:NAD(P)-dependent oxidoreductase [Tenacibaculum sp. SG-28]|uniref:NAD(P)-dependent oxidoreductase n=1 Tax=Tenacibaculum sp. SG-28 TaxID=754426 RepID=UPI000CF3E88F|nr:NAD(P)-dependent oxidoreductase [Tenacibaculum sp. SG-28]PQJ22909.1 alanine dehydrogenase [Tenacibaculum sp. SG-28]